MINKQEKMRDEAIKLCVRNRVNVMPYGNAWWLVGKGVNRVITNLADLTASHLEPLPTFIRKG